MTLLRKLPADWPAIRFAVFKRDSFTCQRCLRVPSSGAWLEADHVVPWHVGGSDDPVNLISLCDGCNADKGATWGPPARLCTDEDAAGLRTWKRWGDWHLQFGRHNAVIAFCPGDHTRDGGDYYVDLESVYEPCWAEHVRLKPWAQADRFAHPLRAAARRALSSEVGEFEGRAFSLAEYVDAAERDLAEMKLREPWLRRRDVYDWNHPPGQPYYDFLDAIEFARRLILSPLAQQARRIPARIARSR